MIRVRFHGRGGQGMKTASRIVGTAAVLDGFDAQDSPVYGAERRGAPVAAYVRIARARIVERGAIPAPHLVVVADDTLLDDPVARPLAGLGPAGALLLATAHGADAVRRRTGFPGPIVARDFLALALAEVGTAAGLSTALAAAACALLGLHPEAAGEALRRELLALAVDPACLRASRHLAELARAGLAPLDLPVVAAAAAVSPVPLVDVAYAPPEVGTPTITAPANTPLRKTGSWRVFRPVVEAERCTRCRLCVVYCPDGAISLGPEDMPVVDYEVCKGCLICVEECPTHAVVAVREVRDWAEVGA